jgi:hypothetical protein
VEKLLLYEMADLIAKFMALQEMEETVYNSNKPWTYKPTAERESPEGKKPPWNGHPFRKSHDTPRGGVGAIYSSGRSVEPVTKTEVTPTGKQTSLSSGDNPPGTQGKGQNRFAASRRCYHCGQNRHFWKDCPNFK